MENTDHKMKRKKILPCANSEHETERDGTTGGVGGREGREGKIREFKKKKVSVKKFIKRKSFFFLSLPTQKKETLQTLKKRDTTNSTHADATHITRK